MKNIIVTGAKGFIGKNLILALKRQKSISVIEYDKDDTYEKLEKSLAIADVVFHLAGVNRPQNLEDFNTGNVGLIKQILQILKTIKNPPPIIMTSSIQADLDNPYGVSKKTAEEEIKKYWLETGNKICIYRLPNVFGKWCKPFYNSVVATFCYSLTHNEPITIIDKDKEINFIYIDDVVSTLIKHLENNVKYQAEPIIPGPTYAITLGRLAEILQQCLHIRKGGDLPDFSDKLQKYLYSTFLSYYDTSDIIYNAEKKEDQRGYLFELIKSKYAGQIFVSRTLPGVTRGNHYHDTKVEKFCILDGSAVIKLRHMVTGEINEIYVEGYECKIIDIPPGWTHNITNIGKTDLITLFWANEVYNPNNPDTYYSEV
ncbi:NAD-dependent epimerase/dehydratase family protein [Gracilinema caldarium]|uniref:polysaccharide biosynthesis C-terminal domain-containing protein n=1 Tax=Gracilinema caldarium TaxID=215591 RepID=UPI0026EFD069|nr:NAD-dependent epimerase/dehydratase family protein [Gracilinema caldarium]